MPGSSRPAIDARLAAALLPALLAVPVLASAFGGLSHPLACRGVTAGPFTVNRADGDGSSDGASAQVASSALVLDAADPEDANGCPGFQLLLQVKVRPQGRVRILLPVLNETATSATATVDLHVGRRHVPIRLGRVRGGGAVSKTIELVLPAGDTDVRATLLLGP